MTTFGEISYDDEVFPDKKPGGGKDLFLRLDEGDNEVRLLTKPFQMMVHKIKKDPNDKKDFGQRVYCSALHGSCPACATGDNAKPRYLYGVLSRSGKTAGTYRVLDVGFMVFGQIRKLAKNVARWGDPTKYDLNIVVDKNGGATGYYSVQPLPKEPLSAADQQIKDNVDLDDLKRRVTPPTPEAAQKRMDSILGDAVPAVGSGAKKVVAKPTQKVQVASLDDDDSPDFPNYDQP